MYGTEYVRRTAPDTHPSSELGANTTAPDLLHRQTPFPFTSSRVSGASSVVLDGDVETAHAAIASVVVVDRT